MPHLRHRDSPFRHQSTSKIKSLLLMNQMAQIIISVIISQTFMKILNPNIISNIPYHYNKRMTGKKNISSIVVGENDKIEFDQVDDKLGFGVLKINRPIGVRSRSNTHEHLNDNESVHSRDSEHTHTDQGFFDLKFYHNRLW